jgi:CPA1 family monovalent cation:H+ antiporter
VHLDTQLTFALLGIVVTVVGLAALAPAIRIPYPILLVIGGLVLGFVPGMPEFELDPELVLIGVLPPLLYSAAFFTSLRDLRANVKPIGLLSVGMVVATTVAVAVVAHAVIDGLPWASAFVLGAVVSPTDPLAATVIARRLGVPRRVVSIVEGESLINDGSALVLYRVAVVAAVSGTFSVWEAGLRFVVTSVGGIAIGLGVGWVVRRVRRRLDNPPVEITISLATAYFAAFPAELLGVSAVLAAVTAGIYLGWHAPELTTPQVRLQGQALWEILTFVVNALLFVLVGEQLPAILDALEGIPTTRLLAYAALVSATVVLTRALLIVPLTELRGLLGSDDEPTPVRESVVVAFAGMRGAVSLAAALAIPLETDAGAPFPGRDLIIFLAFAVILVTLVGQGLALPLVIERLHVEEDGLDEREEAWARIHAADAAILRLEELMEEGWVREDTAERMRGMYAFRRNRFVARKHGEDGDGSFEERSLAYQRLRRELLEAERQAVVALRGEGTINDEVMNRVQRDIDLEFARLDFER